MKWKHKQDEGIVCHKEDKLTEKICEELKVFIEKITKKYSLDKKRKGFIK